MQRVDLDYLPTQFAEVIEIALHGEDVIIMKANHPVLRLARVSESTQRRARGSAKGKIKMADDFDVPLDDFQAYMP